MNDNTINNDVTMGGAGTTVLAGRYRVIRQLGQGGMGSVWLAEDTLLDNRPVAIKMLPSILVSNKRAYNQLKGEALVSLKLTHPNIATVRAFEENNNNPFIVVDYIDGQTLDDCLAEKGELSEEDTIRLLTPIAAALDYAHSKGVIHRDIKPGNVMIAKDGTPYILDFGIAREIQETMTRVTGKMSSGTLMYMSPEQLNGEAPSATQDIYSFAAMAYECLSGHTPFERGNIEYQIINKSPDPLAPQFVKCGSAVMAGLAKTAEARPANCAAVLAGDRTSRTVGSGEGKSRAKWPMVVACVAVGLSVAGLWGWQSGQSRQMAERARIAEQARIVAEQKAAAEKSRADEAARITAEKQAEQARIVAEQKAAAEKSRADEAARIAAEKQAERERKIREDVERTVREEKRAAEMTDARRRSEQERSVQKHLETGKEASERADVEASAHHDSQAVNTLRQRKEDDVRKGGKDEFYRCFKRVASADFTSVYFSVGSYALARYECDKIDAVASRLAASPDKIVVLVGRCDGRSPREGILGLGSSRSSAVSDYLVKAGIDSNRIMTRGYGAIDSESTVKDEVACARDRCCEIAVCDVAFYIVKRGDSLAGISYRYGIRVGAMLKLNGLQNGQIRIGQKLKLPGFVVDKE